jgi:undecaprenyl-diphosphatase
MFALPRCSEVNDAGKPRLPDLPRAVLRGAIPSLPAEPVMLFDLFKAFVLGVVEGLTEFLPVSSTGHLLLVQHFFGFDDDDFGKTFAVLIQFGAILALLSIYFFRIWQIATGMFSDPAARRFVLGVLIAFLPAAVVGALAHDVIKSVLFNVWIVCFTLIVGGAILQWVDRMDLDTRYHDATKFSLPMYFVIGLAQCVSMIPGVSRSGATIVAAMLLGADRRSAAEFSFWLAMPTMAGAFAYDLYKSRGQMSMDNTIIVAFGFAVSFVCAWIVVKTFLDYVQRHGLGLFAWWRVIVGALGLIALALGH